MDPTIYGLAYVQNLSYLGIYLTVAFSGYAIPIPEEVVLILGGYMAAQHIANLPLVILVSILGAVTGDSIIFYLSGHGSRFTQKYHSRVEQTHLGWYLRHMKENTWITIFLSRFIVGMRIFNPLVAGLMKVKWRTFVSATLTSAAIYIPIIVLAGFYSHHQINTFIKIARSVRHGLFILFTLGTAVLVVLFIHNLIQKKR